MRVPHGPLARAPQGHLLPQPPSCCARTRCRHHPLRRLSSWSSRIRARRCPRGSTPHPPRALPMVAPGEHPGQVLPCGVCSWAQDGCDGWISPSRGARAGKDGAGGVARGKFVRRGCVVLVCRACLHVPRICRWRCISGANGMGVACRQRARASSCVLCMPHATWLTRSR
jgi:hypothetical protein